MNGKPWHEQILLMTHGALARTRAFFRSRNPLHRHGNLGVIREYWSSPDRDNDPELYLGQTDDAAKRSQFLVNCISSCASQDSAIFELGCNVGRNLSYLHHAGYSRLHGLEINDRAVELFRRHFPETAAVSTIQCGAAEDLIYNLPDRAYDLTFTMAVLEHIHSDNEWIFEHLARVTRTWLLTIEDEVTWSWRHFPRNYRRVFEPYGFHETKHARLNYKSHGLGRNFHVRLFRR